MQYSEAELIKQSEIDLKSLLNVIWKGKWFIILFTACFMAFGVWYALKQPNVYTASALLAKVDDGNSGGLSGLKSEFGGFAALAGVSLGSKSTANTDIAMPILKSRQFLNQFVTKYDLKGVLMATQSWDPITKEFQYNLDIYDPTTKAWKVNPETNRSFEPSVAEVRDFMLGSLLSFEEDNKKGLVTIFATHYSPQLVKQVTDLLILEINQTIQDTDILEANTRINYLKKALSETPIADMQRIFYQLIEQQEQKKMLAQTQTQYVFKVIDPAIVPKYKSGPKRALIAIGASFAGFILSLFAVIFFHFVVRGKDK
ncbi:lipopolysaccharide biosynthesis [Pseudoalteromonas luteoviolacea B = ATCC 29581]|nr:lipopolysaccharide biosynthesis [Pseudoalteromonas luteoviolacea B = ATCC 29581]